MIRDNFLKKHTEYNQPHLGVIASGIQVILNTAMFVGGNVNGADNYVTQAQTYNDTTWSTTTALPSATGVSGWGGNYTSGITVMGVNNAGYITGSTEFTAGTWTTGGTVNTEARFVCGAAGDGTNAIVFGGYRNTSPHYTTAVNTYNGTSWSTGTALNSSPSYCYGAGTGTSDAMACFGSQGEAQTWNGSSWTTKSTPSGHSYANCFDGSSSSNALVAGGMSSSTAVNTWNGTSWSVVASLLVARQRGTGAGNKDKFIAYGGNSNANSISSTNTWNGTSWSTGATTNSAYESGSGGS